VTGEPKEIVKTADSGNMVKNYFCPDCGEFLVIIPMRKFADAMFFLQEHRYSEAALVQTESLKELWSSGLGYSRTRICFRSASQLWRSSLHSG